MQDPPDKEALLTAVARFLADERWKREIEDPALLFRMRIATHLVETVSREVVHEEHHDRAERTRLEALLELEASEPGARADERRRITALNRALCERLRAGGDPQFQSRALACLQATLREKLSVTQPRFDLSRDIE